MIGQGVWILWGVENCHLPLTKPVAVNTGLALPRSPWCRPIFFRTTTSMFWSVLFSTTKDYNVVPSVLWRCCLGGRKGIRPVENWVVGCWHGYLLSVWSEVQTCIWPSWCHCHSLSLASVKSRLVLHFWYRLTRVVPDKGPLNGCVCVCVLNNVSMQGCWREWVTCSRRHRRRPTCPEQ